MASAEGRIKDRILALLAAAGSPVDDDQIAARIGIVRQQVYDRCHHLARSGPIIRGRGMDGKIVNRRVRPSPSPAKPCRTTSKRQPRVLCLNAPRGKSPFSETGGFNGTDVTHRRGRRGWSTLAGGGL
jgi:hypothetical protein